MISIYLDTSSSVIFYDSNIRIYMFLHDFPIKWIAFELNQVEVFIILNLTNCKEIFSGSLNKIGNYSNIIRIEKNRFYAITVLILLKLDYIKLIRKIVKMEVISPNVLTLEAKTNFPHSCVSNCHKKTKMKVMIMKRSSQKCSICLEKFC